MINPDEKKIVLLPPKTGTLSFESLFREPFCGYLPYRRIYAKGKFHLYLEEAINHYEIKDIENWKIYQTARNPMTRIASAFFFSHKNKYGKGWEENSSFIAFLENLNNKFRSFSKEEIKNYAARLYCPQTFWADSNKYNVKYIKLEEDNSEIYNCMGLPKDLKRPIFNTRSLYSPSEINARRTEGSKKIFKPGDYTDLHTDRTKEIIRSLYKDDFTKMNYDD